MTDEMTSILLTPDEVAVVQEALESWITSAKRDGLYGGLMLSAMMSKDVKGESESGKRVREQIQEASEMQTIERKRKAYAILAKL